MTINPNHPESLLNTIRRAMQLGQIEVYGRRARFYHRGLYSNGTSLWSHTPTTALLQSGNYMVTTCPQQSLSLAVLRKGDFERLFFPLINLNGSVSNALARLCNQINELRDRFPVNGIASYPLEPNGHYQYVILFRPLDCLMLLDIEPVTI